MLINDISYVCQIAVSELDSDNIQIMNSRKNERMY